ncbi:YegP family protein [Flavobacterium sp. JAS]|uniref:YegP family protein n=1 Tax=Flavobacterium sp. JAS TaxID=2897329 RepID=UPI001E4AD517|nr:YegP family protein [Flavobacterium sp. JAS]MCD0472685.1 YegP family protein [Flavobacterium sp. JAS]
MGKFVITKKECGKFQVCLKSNTGQVLLTSQELRSKISCRKAIEQLRTYTQEVDKFHKKTATDWELYFYLKSTNGRTIGISSRFPSALARDQAIKMIQKLAPNAFIEDQC